MDRTHRVPLLLLSFAALLACAHSQCPHGWRENENTCYFFSTDTKTWLNAESFCLSQNSQLMSIKDVYERTWIKTQLESEIYWIGLNDRITEDVWEWTDGTAFDEDLAEWSPGQPDNWGDSEDCGQLLGAKNGLWNDDNCGVARRYICKHVNENGKPRCDSVNGWKEYNSNCYKLEKDNRKSWSNARIDCLQLGGDLVSITSDEEEQYIIGILDSTFFDLWIGLTTLKCTSISCQVVAGNTEWTWSDASKLDFENWGTGQPTVDEESGSCSAIIKDPTAEFGNWRSHLCRYERPYMCKRALNTTCPAGWLSFSGSCYEMVSNNNMLTTWYEAHTRCTEQGAHLLTINSEEEQYFINGLLPDFHLADIPDIWIGLSDKDKDGVFKWVDNTEIKFPNWADGWPQNTAEYWDCGQIYTGNYQGKWQTTSCFKSRGYICEMTGGQTAKPTASADYHCDRGYVLYGSSCYSFVTEVMRNWQDAEAHCVSQQAHLTSVSSEEELSFIVAHMPAEAWVGLNDISKEGDWVYTDGTSADFLPWAPNQPDNYQNNEDCVHIRGLEHSDPGKFNDIPCTYTKDAICKKAAGQGPPPQPPTNGPNWNVKCGSWMSDPFNDYCYLFDYVNLRTWAEARADCVNQGGDLVSITDPFEQAFIQGVIQVTPVGVSLWIGGHDSITEGGWEWTDGKPFNYIRWNQGSPDNYMGENCLSILVNDGYWNDDNCGTKRGYICKRRGDTEEPSPPHDGYMTFTVCGSQTAVLHCEKESVINIHSIFYGRRSPDICPALGGTEGTCTVNGVLPYYRQRCDNKQFCFAPAPETDSCPDVSKYVEIVYSCEQKVCLHGLGIEDGNITDSQLTASSSFGSFDPSKARLNGNSCWRPSGSATTSWIQVDLVIPEVITGIVIQGCPQNDYWVTKYRIQHSWDGTTFNDYTADGDSFPGATDKTTPETQLLGSPVVARYVRIFPLEYNGEAGLRFDVLGCTPDYAVPCSSWPGFSNGDKVTVHCPSNCGNAYYRVFGTGTYRGDSNICAAAIHAGVVLNENGGECTLIKKEGLDFYPGSVKNGITSAQYDGTYAYSYVFSDGELRCPGPDWFELGEFCYKPSSDKKTWSDARATCRTMGAELVSVLSMTEQSWLESYLYMTTSNVWLGLNDLFVPGLFMWSDEHPVTFTYWAPGQPNNHIGFKDNCVEMLHTTGRWNDDSCSDLNIYVCKMAKAHYPLPSVKPTVYGCPQGWDAYGYSCYWMEETAKTWSEAKEFCTGMDSSMLHIGDIYEQSHFTVALSQKTGMWWIGLRAHAEGGGVDYVWDNGLPVTFTHWDKNQPDSGDGNCVAMTTGTTGGFWDDKECSETLSFICEKARPDISPPTKPPTPPPAQGCAEGWTSLGHFRYCYRLFHNVDWSEKKSWQGAYQDCTARGADLVSIHSQEEEEFLARYSKGFSKWIGLKLNALEGGHSWSDGTPLSHTNWGYDEPNNHEGREECVEMVSSENGTLSWWNDLNCDAHQDWICKITKGKTPILPPVPPAEVPAPDCGTNPGWRKNNGICYYYNDTDIVDYITATERCIAESSLLVSIHDKDEQAYVNSMVGTGEVSAAWIGLFMFGIANGQYMWEDQSPLTYTHWSPGEPNNANGEEQCVQMNRHQGGWNDANCGRASAGYVCKKYPGTDHTRPPPTQAWEGYCPSGWYRFGSKCFLFKGMKDDIQANWSYARSWCREQGADLAVIDSLYENDFVASYLRDMHHPTWIGLSDILEENQYAWSDGVSPVRYTNWAEGEPNNAEGAEHCVAISHTHLSTGKWNDDGCGKEQSFVCSMKKSGTIEPPAPTKSPCLDGYVSWYGNCYKLVEDKATWDAAEAACQGDGGHLTSIDQSYDQAFVAAAVLHGKDDAWIGLKRKDNTSYGWSDGWPVFFTHWGPGEPSNKEGEGCVSMHGSHFLHGTWNDTKCEEAKNYICKTTTEKPPPTLAPGDGKCLPYWTPYGRHCYIMYDGKEGFSWPDSRHFCQSIRAELASIHSRAEVEFIRKLNFTRYHNVWIGLTRDSNFGWAWTDLTSVALLNWAKGEPNDAFHPGDVAEENCVEMYHDGTWNDNNCLQKRGFVCKHRQFYSTDEGGNPIYPTDNPGSGNAGMIAGVVIAVIIVVVLVAGLLYYVFRVRGYKFSGLSLPSGSTSRIDVPAFNNPNFSGTD